MSVPVAKGKNPAKLQHDYVMVATFAIGQNEVDQLAAARVDPSGEGQVPLNLSQEKMISLDGPGCKNCGLEWTVAYGQPCAGRPDLSGMMAGPVEEVVGQPGTALPTTMPPPPPPLPRTGSGIILPNGQESGAGGLLLPDGMQMPSAE